MMDIHVISSVFHHTISVIAELEDFRNGALDEESTDIFIPHFVQALSGSNFEQCP